MNAFDNFLCGMAFANHAAYLSNNWEKKTGDCTKIFAYVAGMGEHLLYIIFKVVTFVAFIFINIGLLFHYLFFYCTKNRSDSEVAKRQTRLYVGLLIIGETIPGICCDLIGVFCPPAGYRINELAKQCVTRRCFEKWGIDDEWHTIEEENMKKEKMSALIYFSKVGR